MRRVSRIAGWAGAVLGILILLAFVASYLMDDIIGRRMQNDINDALKGYRVALADFDFHPFGFAVTLEGVTLVQTAYPDPPVARIDRLRASVHWAALLRGRLVADFLIAAPRIHINREQLRQESRDESRIEERGWQEAVNAIYPLKINRLEIQNGQFTYIDEDPDKPIHLQAIALTAENIRNVETPEGVYPSPFQGTAQVIEDGQVAIRGQANFLAEPFPGLRADLEFRAIDLERLEPIATRYRLDIGGGRVAAEGSLEYAPRYRSLRLRQVRIEEARIAYRNAPEAERAQEKAGSSDAAEEARGEAEFSLRIDDLRLSGEIGFVDPSRNPPYYLFLRQTDMKVTNLSSHFRDGPAEATIEGRFMGSGDTNIVARFGPETDGPDFDLFARIVGTEATALNDLLRAHANFDVTEGRFSLFTEIHVEDQRIDGYIKPFFKDLEVYDAGQESEQSLFQKLYEGLIGGIAEILKNESSDRLATMTDISGPIEDPEADTWQVIANLIQNAFFDIILPGFEPNGNASGGRENPPQGS